jgi:hypothetical protein
LILASQRSAVIRVGGRSKENRHDHADLRNHKHPKNRTRIQREPELLGQTVVMAEAARASDSKRPVEHALKGAELILTAGIRARSRKGPGETTLAYYY